MSLATVVDTLRSAFSSRDALVDRLTALQAAQATAGAERQRKIDAVQTEVDKLDEPRRRLQRLHDEALSASNREGRELEALQHELREHPSRELARFETMLGRLFDIMRATRVPSPEHLVNELSGARTTTNLDEITRHLDFGHVLSRHRVELRDTLWRLPSADLAARIGELKAELEAAVAGTVFAKELS